MANTQAISELVYVPLPGRRAKEQENNVCFAARTSRKTMSGVVLWGDSRLGPAMIGIRAHGVACCGMLTPAAAYASPSNPNPTPRLGRAGWVFFSRASGGKYRDTLLSYVVLSILVLAPLVWCSLRRHIDHRTRAESGADPSAGDPSADNGGRE